MNEDDRPRRCRLPDRPAGGDRQAAGRARRGKSCRAGAHGPQGSAARRPHGRPTGDWSRCRTLGHQDLRRHALLEDDDDAVPPAARGQDVDCVAFACPATEKNADGVHATWLEHVGCRLTDPAPECAPLRHCGGNHLLGLSGDGGRAVPMPGLDRLRHCGRGARKRQDRRHGTKGQSAPTQRESSRRGDWLSAQLHDKISQDPTTGEREPATNADTLAQMRPR